MVWMFPAAPGFLAAPSTADAAIRDWPIAPAATAIAKPNTAAIALYLLTVNSLSADTAPAPVWDSAVIPVRARPTAAKTTILTCFMYSSPVKGDSDLEKL